ncbi:MAG: regulatory protein RecX [Burkholderiaceae bacterium]
MTDDPSSDRPSSATNPASVGPTKAYKALRQHAFRFLSRRDYSRAELQKRLAVAPRPRPASRRGLVASAVGQPAPVRPEPPDPRLIEQVLDELVGRGYLSDERFAGSLARRAREKYGPARLAQLMRQHQIEPTVAAPIIASERASEAQRAHAVWARRFDKPPADLAERARQTRYLASRGFSGAIIAKVLRLAGASTDDDAFWVDEDPFD